MKTMHLGHSHTLNPHTEGVAIPLDKGVLELEARLGSPGCVVTGHSSSLWAPLSKGSLVLAIAGESLALTSWDSGL